MNAEMVKDEAEIRTEIERYDEELEMLRT